MRIVPSIRRQRLARPRTAGVETQPRGDDAAVSRSALLRKVARRRSAASTRTVIGSRQLVAGNPFPPLASLLYSIPGLAGGGGSFHEAAGSRSLRRFIIRPAGVFLLPAMVAGVFSRSARAGCVRAGRGGVCEIQLGRLDGRKARKAADFERRAALAKYLIWSLGGYGPLGSHSKAPIPIKRSNEKRQADKNPRVFLRGHKS